MVWTVVRNAIVAAGLLNVAAAGDPWGYRENDPNLAGPSNWGSINPACNGQHQSPIDLKTSGPEVVNLWGTTSVPPLKFYGDCKNFNLRTLEDLFKWEFSGDSGCQLKLQLEDNKSYTLAQFHVHTFSEHTIDGHHYGGEIHFVHKEDGGSGLLVTGLLLNVERDVRENEWIENVWRTFNQADESAPVPVDLQLNYVDLLNHQTRTSHLFNYRGSLTTPPCSEIVNWWVINNPVSISVEEYERLKEKYQERPANENGHDNRPVQPLNDRQIHYY